MGDLDTHPEGRQVIGHSLIEHRTGSSYVLTMVVSILLWGSITGLVWTSVNRSMDIDRAPPVAEAP